MAFSLDSKLLVLALSDKTIRLWDASSGAALQTLEVDVVVKTLSFSEDGNFLRTNRGPLPTGFLSDCAPVSRPNFSCCVFVKDQWASRGMENILWLPYKHRPSHVAIHGSIIGFGYPSGRVTFIEFTF
jgi:WD40 repeat protein